MASPEMGNVIDFRRARDLRRERAGGVEVNWYTLTPMLGFAMWAGMILGTIWIWHRV